MSQKHEHDHAHETSTPKRLALALGLAAAYMAAEVIGGLYTNSLALLADAGHMLGDVSALSLALVAGWLAKRPGPARRTYGNHRAEVLAALANAVALLVVGVVIITEAVERWGAPRDVVVGPMLIVAFGGLLVNVAAMFILNGGQDDSVNMKGAFLHVAADALGSVGAMASGIAIWAFDWRWADAAASFAIATLVIVSAVSLLRRTLRIVMESAESDDDIDALKQQLLDDVDVVDVHDVHVWTLSGKQRIASAHVVASENASKGDVLVRLHKRLAQEGGVDHATLQVERVGAGLSCECVFQPTSV